MAARVLARIIVLLMTTLSFLSSPRPILLSDKLPPITAENANQIEEMARLGNGSVDQLLWAPNGQYVVAFGASGTWLFDRDNLAEPQMHIQTHSDRVKYAAFSPDSYLIATGGDDAVSIIVVETGELLHTLETARDFVAFSPDGNWIITDSQRAADSPMVWSVSSGEMIVSLERNELAQITAITFSQDGNQMAAVYESGRWGYMNAIKIWNTQTWNELLKISTAGHRIQQIAFSDSNMRLTACTEMGILSWNVEDGSPAQANTEDIACSGENLTKTLANFGIDPNDVQGEALSPDHSLVAFIDADGFLETGNTVTQHRQASVFAFSSSYIREVTFSPNNQLIAAIEGRYDGTVDIRLWYLVPSRTSSTSITVPDSQWSSSIHLAFLSNDRLMIYDNRAGRVRIWDIEAEEFITDFSIDIDERSGLAVSPDPSVITSVSWQPDMSDVSLLHMQTWDIASGELLTDYLNPGSYERSPLLGKAVYSPNGEFIATAGRAAHLWNSQTGKEVGVFYDYTFLL